MKSYLLLFLFLSASTLPAQNIIESCKTGQSLIDAVRVAYKPDLTLGYGPARDTLYSKIDNNGLTLSGIYTDFTVPLEAGKDPSITVFQNEQGLNAEHVYPQSKGARQEPGRSDMHHVFPSKVDVNAARGSCIFGEVADTDTDFWFVDGERLTQMPMSDIDAYSEKNEAACVFEPRESVKGDMARAVFYFYTIYQQLADREDKNFFPRQKDILLKWHRADPVSEKELRRNELIAFYQGNLNPFIVDTSLAVRAFFKEDAVFEEGNPNCVITSIGDLAKEDWVHLQSNLVVNEISLESSQKNVIVHLVTVSGQIVKSTQFDYAASLIVGDLPKGIYFLAVQSEGLYATFKVGILR